MRSRPDPRRSFRPLLEALETRALLSVCTVDRLTDVGEGTGMAGDLRYCIEQAQDKDSIQFAVKGTINLTRPLPDLTRSVGIEGPGADLLTVRRDAGGAYRIFTVTSSASVVLSGLTITNGVAPPSQNGGGIFNEGTLTLNHATVRGNRAGNGGGVFNVLGATLTLNHATVSGNQAADEGGGIYNRNGSVTLNNSTVSGNEAMFEGGGIFNNHGATLTLNHSTVSDNGAIVGGGIVIFGPFTARNTIIAGNTAIIGADLDGHLGSLGHNLIGNSNGGTGYAPTDLLNVNPLLGPLQDNGGPTPTHTLLAGSLAIDAGDNESAPEFDQRGLPRVTGNVIDIGAFEVQPGPVASFYLYAPDSAIAGVSFDLAVFAYDAAGYRATTYTGTVAFFSSTDPDAELPGPYTFTEADAGWVYLPESAVLYAEGLQEVGVYDVDTFAAGLAYVEVLPGDGPDPFGGHRPDAAALSALLLSEPARVRR